MNVFSKIKNFFGSFLLVFNKFFKQFFTAGLRQFVGMYIQDAISAARQVDALNLPTVEEKQKQWFEIFKKESKANPQEFGMSAWGLLRELAVVHIRKEF